jgi:hypothetical protein
VLTKQALADMTLILSQLLKKFSIVLFPKEINQFVGSGIPGHAASLKSWEHCTAGAVLILPAMSREYLLGKLPHRYPPEFRRDFECETCPVCEILFREDSEEEFTARWNYMFRNSHLFQGSRSMAKLKPFNRNSLADDAT